ncbi:hypothetical protein KXX33_006377 [Aspergillus fumigatus]|nr:hypothetical protein KXX48_003518 [Aspergillus fumigatus]KAH1358483.1 hypothetical protein KXX33_006377 [Aspergillus fumigatus]KAH1380331.1 hypothetical protein KXX10_007766 [Aspergillus fumigatus]KAH1648626.1 hypothetical protein KXX59_005710 [Aspergillus fumigatus]KAH1681961.1 hypothetical protein KXX46_004853 [Aspergillus fumigatus]
MWRKRKAASPAISDPADNFRKRRWKVVYVISSSDDENDENDDSTSSLDEDEWYINCILDETESQYLIDWEGPWSPTWSSNRGTYGQEPKANANEAAIKAWEEKKKETNNSLSRNYPDNPSPVCLADSHCESRSSLSPGPTIAEGRIEPPRSHDRSPSPLFVPLDEGPHLEENTNEALAQPDQALTFSQESKGSRPSATKENKHRPPLSVTTPNHSGCVFEYITRSSIPSRYRLPGEITEPNSPVGSKVALSGINATQTSSQALLGIRNRPVDEVAETPPSVAIIPESQRTRVISGTKRSGSQTPNIEISQESNSTSLGSRFLPGSSSLLEDITVRHVSSVPETVLSHQSQNAGQSPEQSLNPRPIPSKRKALASVAVETVAMDAGKGGRETPSLAETMEKYSQYEGSTPLEKIRNAHAQIRAKTNPGTPLNADASVTPSSAGDIEPSPSLFIPEVTAPLSVRVDREDAPHTAHAEGELSAPDSLVQPTEMDPPQQPILQTIHPSALTVSHQEQAIPGSVQLGPSEFAVPLPMDSRVKDDYERILKDEAQSIDEFLKTFALQAETSRIEQERLIPRMNSLLERLSNTSTHPDLNITEHIKDSDSDLAKEAAWAEYSSAKFLLLGYLINNASSHDLHLVIMVHGAKTLKILERFLMGKGLSYTRPRHEMGIGTNLEVSMVKESLSFGIQSTIDDGIMETYKPPAAIVALDSSFNATSPSVEHMRTTYARHGNLLPVIRLLVSNSSEHVQLCFANYPEPHRLRLVVQYTSRLRDVVGDLQDDALGVYEDSEEILSSLLSDNLNAHWSLPSIEPLHIVSSDELTAALSPYQNQPETALLPIPQVSKRLFQVEDTTEQTSKRPRMEESQDASQFTEASKESIKFPSQTLDNDLRALEAHLLKLKTSHAAELDKLQKALADAQSRLQEREGILSLLQHRYESRTKELHKVRQERDRLVEAKLSSEQRLEKQKEDNIKLKDERTQLRHELEKAREALKAGGGSMAELERAQEEIRRLTKANASLERKAEYEAKQAEYTREQYQTASNVAAQSGNEILQLKEENESLKRKVAGDASRLRELNIQSDEQRHLARVKELEAMLASREDLLRRKEDELREFRKNRPSTRSTSTQPRSPKWTAANSRPTSPGINNHNGSGYSGRGSGLRFSSEVPL